MRKLAHILASIIFAFCTYSPAIAQVSLVSSGGISTSASYSTLKGAFDKIDSGYHTGVVSITISGNITETSPAVLVASGTSNGARYSSVNISPVGGPWTISGSFSSNALIILDGADNVIINGGLSRNLIFYNSGTTSPASIWLKSGGAAGLGCSNDTIINCQIKTGVMSSESYGVIVSGYNSTSPVPTSSLAAYDCDNTLIKNNIIYNCFYGISVSGNDQVLSDNFRVEANEIGSNTTSTSIGKYGIYVNNMDSIVIYKNKITNVISTSNSYGIYLYNTKSFKVQKNSISKINTSTAAINAPYGPFGIYLYNCLNTAAIKGYIDGNTISSIAYTGTVSTNVDAYGIYATKSSFLEIRNNSIAGVLGSGYGTTSMASALTSSTFGIFIDDPSSINVNIDFNSINLFGKYPFSTGGSTYYTASAAIGLNNASITNVNIFDNVLVDSIQANSTTGSTFCFAIYTATGFAFNGTSNNINYNCYYVNGSGANIAYYNSTAYSNYSAWKTVVATDLNSFALNPNFNSVINLIPLPNSLLLGKGIPIVDINTDLFDSLRSNISPTLGAYEVAVDMVAPIITYTKLTNTLSTSNRTLIAVITDNSRGVDTLSNMPRLYYKKSTAANDSAGWKYVIANGYSTSSDTFTIDYSKLVNVGVGDTIQYFIIAKDKEPLQTNITLSSGTLNSAQKSVNLSASAFPIGGTIDSYFIAAGLSGTVTVGNSGKYATLTGADGAFNAINSAFSVTGDVILKIVSDITEPGTIGLRNYSSLTGNEKIFIVPDTATLRTISGSKDNIGLLRFVNAKNVIVDGAYNGAGRYLKFSNTVTQSTSVNGATIQLANTAGTSALGCRNITIKNSIIVGTNYISGSTTVGRYAIYAGDSLMNTDGNATMADHDSITIQNNMIYRGYTLVYSTGGTNAYNDVWNIKDNVLAAAAVSTETNTATGIHIYKSYHTTIGGNLISGINSKDSASGIFQYYLYNSNTINNTINAISSSSGSTIGIYNYYGTNDTISRNTIVNLSTSVAHLYGICNRFSINNIISGNTIKRLNSTYSSGWVYGIYNSYYKSLTVANNLITNMSNVATSASYPLGGIYNLGYNSTAYNGDSLYLFNNSISALSSNSYLFGIYVSAGKGHKLFHNAVHLTGTRASTNYSAALFFTYSTSNTTLIDSMFNNNFTNLIVNSSAGKCYSVYVDNATVTNVAFNNSLPGGSNYNNLYSYGNSNNIMALWKGVAYASLTPWCSNTGQDANSLSIDPSFSAANVLVPSTSSQLYSSKGVQTSVKTDILGNSRTTTPTIGAYEQYTDITSPTITYTSIVNTYSMSNPTLDVVINDDSGVNFAHGFEPRLYYKKSTQNNDSSSWKYATGLLSSTNIYKFTIDYSKIGPVNNGVTIQYFVVAQDSSSQKNVGFSGSCSPFANQSSVALSSSAFPVSNYDSYKVIPTLTGTCTVGTGGNFATLTGENGLFYWLDSASAIAGNLSVQIISDISEPSTYDLSNITRIGGDWKISIVPDGTTLRILKGQGKTTTGGVFRFTSVRNITIDGSNNGSGSYLMFTDSLSSISNIIPILQIAGPGQGSGCSSITVQNCNIKGSYNGGSSLGSYCIYIGNSDNISASAANSDNDSISIFNNLLTRAHYGIVTSALDGTYNNDNINIKNNILGSTIASEYITINGMYLNGCPNGIVSGNEVRNIINNSNAMQSGISVNSYCHDMLVEKNIIHGIYYSGTSSGGKGEGITVGNNATCNSLKIFNNVIYSINGVGYSSYPVGIAIYGTHTSIQIYHNTVNLAGSYVSSSYTSPIKSMSLYVDDAPTLDVLNNIFVNTLTSSTATSGGSYAVYIASNSFVFTTSTFDYNDYYSNPANKKLAVFAYANTVNFNNIWAWNGLTGYYSSLNIDPVFNNDSALILNYQSSLITTYRGGSITGVVPRDILDVVRSNTPTIGAYEKAGDVVAPMVSFLKILNWNPVPSVTLSAVINDKNTGLDTALATRPTLYFKKTSQANDSLHWKSVIAIGTVPNFTFTLDSTSVSGFHIGDTIQYFIVARDKESTPNYTISSGTNSGTFSSTKLDSSNFPISGNIDYFRILEGISGVKTIGVAGEFTSLTGDTGVFKKLNTCILVGDLTLKISSDLNESGANELDYLYKVKNYPYTVKIIPDTNTIRTISGNYNGALIRMQAINGVTLDGSNSAGSDKYLKFINTPTSTTSTAATLAIISAGANNGCKNIAIKNSIVVGPINNNSTTYAVFAGSSSFGALYGNNDSINIENCWIYRGCNLIYNVGTSAQTNNYWTIKGNTFGASTIESENNTSYGLYLAYNQYDTISGNTISGLNITTAVNNMTICGLYESYCTNGTIFGNTFSTFQLTATAAQTYNIYGASFNNCNYDNVYKNTFTSFTVSGTPSGSYFYVYGVSFNAGSYEKFYKNNVSSLTGTFTNTMYPRIYGLMMLSTNNSNIYNNVFTQFSSKFYGYGLYVNAANDTIYNNIISNTATTSSFNYGVYIYGDYHIVSKNKVSGISSVNSSAFGMYVSGGAFVSVTQNTLKNISSPYSTANVYGINTYGATSIKITDNLISGLTTTGSSSNIHGIYINYNSGGWIERNILKSFTSSASLYGINYSSPKATTNDSLVIDNNSISALSSLTNLYAVYCSSGKIKKFLYNSIELSGIRNVKYDSYGLYTTSCSIDSIFENSISNIISNSNTTSNFNYCIYNKASSTYSVSDYNNLYAGDPTVLPNNYVCYKTSKYQTLAQWQSGVSLDLSSISGDPNYATGTYLMPKSNSILYSSGSYNPISVIVDIAGNTRKHSAIHNAIGCYDAVTDLDGPAITFSRINLSKVETSKTLAVNIVDGFNSVDTVNNKPRLYYKKSTANNDSATWQCSLGTGMAPNFNFLFDYSKLGGVQVGDVVQFFIVAQDTCNAPKPNISINTGSSMFDITNVMLTSEMFPITGYNTFTIAKNICGVKTVGTRTGFTTDYPTLTSVGGAFADIDTSILAGDLTLKIVSDISESGASDLSLITRDGGDWKVRIAPDTNVLRTLTVIGRRNDASGHYRFLGVRNVSIDGAFNGMGKFLKFNNDCTDGLPYILPIIQIAGGGVGSGCVNFTLQNCYIRGAYNGFYNPENSYAIYVGNSTISSNGISDNDSVSIINNAISRSHFGIVVGGNAVANNDNLIIKNNIIGSTDSNEYVSSRGMYINGSSNCVISGNEIMNITNNFKANGNYGINIGNYCDSVLIEKNIVNNVSYTGTDKGYGCGLLISGASNYARIINNAISGIGGAGYPNYSMPRGISLQNGSRCHTLYYNSVNLYGEYVAPNYSAYSSAFYIDTILQDTLDVRNNVFSNTLTTSIATSGGSYAVYVDTSLFSFATCIFDYNDYYSETENTVLTKLGFFGADIFSLHDWQISTLQDMNSKSVAPDFYSNTILMPTSSSSILSSATPISISTDIMDDARNNSTPTIGAYESVFTSALPSVETSAIVSPISQHSATSTGNIISKGGSAIQAKGMVIDIASYPNLTNNSAIVGNGAGLGAITANWYNLDAQRVYYVRAFATNLSGTSYGANVSFTTLPNQYVPAVTSSNALSITSSSAVLKGVVTNDYNSAITERGFIWNSTNDISITDYLGKASVPAVSGSYINAYSATLSGLEPSTTYYFRAYAINGIGASYGSVLAFTTLVEGYTLSGNVSYAQYTEDSTNTKILLTKSTFKAMPKAPWVKLYNASGTLVDSTTADAATGAFSFTKVVNGAYRLVLDTNMTWTTTKGFQLTLVDYKYIKEYVVSLVDFDSLQMRAANIDRSGSGVNKASITLFDAANLMQRIVGLANASTWKSSNYMYAIETVPSSSANHTAAVMNLDMTVVVSGADKTGIIVRGLSSGDVNGQ